MNTTIICFLFWTLFVVSVLGLYYYHQLKDSPQQECDEHELCDGVGGCSCTGKKDGGCDETEVS